MLVRDLLTEKGVLRTPPLKGRCQSSYPNSLPMGQVLGQEHPSLLSRELFYVLLDALDELEKLKRSTKVRLRDIIPNQWWDESKTPPLQLSADGLDLTDSDTVTNIVLHMIFNFIRFNQCLNAEY